MDIKNFNNKLKVLIENQKLNLRKLSKELKIPYSSLFNYVQGRRLTKIEHLISISKYFGVSVDDLLGNENYSGGSEELISSNIFTDQNGSKRTIYKIQITKIHKEKI